MAVPKDEAHEYLKCWVDGRDPEFRAWIRWFDTHHVVYTVGKTWMTLNGRTAEYYMLYTHRYTTIHGGDIRRSRWCCQ